MRTFESAKTRAAVQFILQAIILCVAAFFYVKFYFAFRGAEGTILQKLQANLLWTLLFGGASLVWLFNWIASMRKYGNIKRYWGRYFGCFIGRLLLLLELAGYILVIVFLFI